MPKTRTHSLAFCVLAAALAPATSTAAPDSPEELVRGTRFCLQPVTIPIDDSEEDERRLDVEAALVRGLDSRGFPVADVSEVGERMDALLEEAGGLIDPVTGRRDPERYSDYRARVGLALSEEFDCDVQMAATVTMVQAAFGVDGFAKWDGATFRVSSKGRVSRNEAAGVLETGWVPALSLWMTLMDLEGNPIGFRSAGIETLVEFAVERELDLLPEDAWLTNTPRISAAIGSALGSDASALLHRSVPEVDSR